MNQHARITAQQFSGAVIFDTAEDMLTAMFGPSQHDAHVREFKIERGEIELTPWQRSVREAKATKRAVR
jgi:hypothetical protein